MIAVPHDDERAGVGEAVRLVEVVEHVGVDREVPPVVAVDRHQVDDRPTGAQSGDHVRERSTDVEDVLREDVDMNYILNPMENV